MGDSDSREDQDMGIAPGAITQLARLLDGADGAWVLTGAGMSTESGLPDYRGPSGVWKNRSFAELASIEAMRREPREFWDFYRMRLDHLGDARPNAAHEALARMERAGIVERVVTQNVDGLHQLAGSEGVLELHGSLRVARCRSCGVELPIEEARERWSTAVDAVPRCDCGEVLGPGVVLFGEALPLAIETAFELAGRTTVALALGTSLEVFPAAHLPLVTVERGGLLGIVTQGSTQFDDLAAVRIDARLGRVLPAVADELLGSASA
ncbi:MAG: Silent information regulator protein Sir2 [Thermoleophilia bacterium]|nr:Silent information regulator protein Sir2 [Thermoleophilia bacterium]